MYVCKNDSGFYISQSCANAVAEICEPIYIENRSEKSISLPGGPAPCPGPQVGTPGVNAGTALPSRCTPRAVCSEVTLLRQSFLGPPTHSDSAPSL